MEQRRLHAARLVQELSAVGDGSSSLESQTFNIKRLLQDFEFFQDLAPTVREQLPSIVHLEADRKKGDVIFRQGDAPGCCYIVLSGSVSVWKEDEASLDGSPRSRCPKP